MNKGTNSAAVNFTDADNNWTAAEYNNVNKDNGALDAHWEPRKHMIIGHRFMEEIALTMPERLLKVTFTTAAIMIMLTGMEV
jgi:hypothetical protein